ncbi:MAG: bifunctional phosphopantothenoylcysteine decarboxylase/phosphopantothenate--cysteine ligase CoaBC [Deltaproteobacteria bacterium]|nr:bifunctional phosphopantothenoylcysteine decarboxylase/phosphopantothenate--cysteine ligase CoaBC [Deltaproteobacteria bacterium]
MEKPNVVLGVTGGIACYKALELVRLLVQDSCNVRVVMTREATEFVAPLSFQTLSGAPVGTDLFSLTQESEIGHINLADSADVLVIAPATANVIAKLAAGIADDLLTTVVLATQAPLLVVPSMNVHMLAHPMVQANIAKLRSAGYHVMEAAAGYLACGYEGKGRLPEPPAIAEEIRRLLRPKDLSGEKIVVTAGPSREPLDPVRYLSNRSSGKMGYALARAAARRGARVTLVSGPTALAAPEGVTTVSVVTAEEMRAAVLAEFDSATAVLMAAAVADYRPRSTAGRKMKRGDGNRRVELVPNPDIVAELTARKRRQVVVVGFAAETESLVENARQKLHRKNLDLVVANDVTQEGSGFDVDTNAVTLLDRDGTVTPLPVMSKDAVADRICDWLLQHREHSHRRGA